MPRVGAGARVFFYLCNSCNSVTFDHNLLKNMVIYLCCFFLAIKEEDSGFICMKKFDKKTNSKFSLLIALKTSG